MADIKDNNNEQPENVIDDENNKPSELIIEKKATDVIEKEQDKEIEEKLSEKTEAISLEKNSGEENKNEEIKKVEDADAGTGDIKVEKIDVINKVEEESTTSAVSPIVPAGDPVQV